MSEPMGLLERAPEPEEEPMSGEWLTVAEAAKRLNLHRSTIYRHLNDGTLPCESIRIGRAWRIRATGVDTLRADLLAVLRNGGTDANASVLAALIGDET